MKDAPGTRDYDWWLLAILTTICALGVIEIYSATHGSSLAGMHWKQVRWLAVGFILMLALSRLDYHLILDQAPILYLLSIAALIAVLVVGHTRFGADRKSTRLNSSHVEISYAVFCLKKKRTYQLGVAQ